MTASAVRAIIRTGSSQTPAEIAANFRPSPRTRVAEILQTLTTLGQLRSDDGQHFTM